MADTSGGTTEKQVRNLSGTQSAAITNVVTNTVDATYGADEQAVIEDLRTKLNSVLAALRTAKIIKS